ncbi:hypothetical protein [Neorhizobium sp. JUb45]|uniref:hypothetical protein n=1 Tax=unclassified Neorhizobium TaxID=2629175 RepID=UPI0010D649BB|nr:hypothetical protein [Neorhizobium sp. JUb45]TCR04225.1 hypothetical protein EDF70_102323 [Neorhizobium sp. JUb45]
MRVLRGDDELHPSTEDFDWLGPGIYFWENDPKRAREWAEWKVARGRYREAFVLGAVIDLGNCLDLLMRENLDILRVAYETFCETQTMAGLPIPENQDIGIDRNKDKLLRFLDCAVIRHLHAVVDMQIERMGTSSPVERFDTVRGLFTEGEPAYPGGGFFRKTHTQIAVVNPRRVIGYFLPR